MDRKIVEVTDRYIKVEEYLRGRFQDERGKQHPWSWDFTCCPFTKVTLIIDRQNESIASETADGLTLCREEDWNKYRDGLRKWALEQVEKDTRA